MTIKVGVSEFQLVFDPIVSEQLNPLDQSPRTTVQSRVLTTNEPVVDDRIPDPPSATAELEIPVATTAQTPDTANRTASSKPTAVLVGPAIPKTEPSVAIPSELALRPRRTTPIKVRPKRSRKSTAVGSGRPAPARKIRANATPKRPKKILKTKQPRVI
jgi:hypothetical protein